MKYKNLSQLLLEPNTHNAKIIKRTLVKNGQIPHLVNLARATFPPGELAPSHSHADMYEIFLVEKGKGVVKVNGKTYALKSGICVIIEPGDTHEFINSSKKDLIMTYLGIVI